MGREWLDQYAWVGRVLTVVVAQSATVAVLLAFFGWVRAQSYYGYFGISGGMLGLTSTDYLRNAPSLAVPTLIYAGVTALAVGAAAITIEAAGRRWRWSAVLAVTVLAASGLGGCVLGMASIRGYDFIGLPSWMQALQVGVGLALLLAATGLAHRVFTRSPRLPVIGTGTMLVVIASSCMWALTLRADDIGTQAAQDFAARMPEHSAVSVYSTTRLAVSSAGGVSILSISLPGSKYTVRYDNLRLLAQGTNGDLYLLPKDWRKGQTPVIVIHSGNDIRLDIVATAERERPR